MKPKICKQCGKEFEAEGKRIYCSDECAQKMKLKHTMEWNSRHSVAKLKQNAKSERKSRIEEIETKARAEGLSYGQYQAQRLMEYARVTI